MNDQYLWFNYPDYKLPKLHWEGDKRLEKVSEFSQKYYDNTAKIGEQDFVGCWCASKKEITDYMKKYSDDNNIDYYSTEYKEELDKVVKEHLIRGVRWAKVNASFKVE